MAGFDNDVVYGTNVDFTGTLPVSGQMNQNGELLVGATTAPFIRSHVPIGTNGVSIATGPGTIDFSLSNIPNSALANSTINVIAGNGLSGGGATSLGNSVSLQLTTPVTSTNGGTGVNNGSSTITLGGSLTTSGAFASTFTMTAATSVTFPTTGTLATTSQLPSITATQYDVLVGGAANAVVSVGPGSAGQVLQSGGNAANPAYSTPTYPSASGTAGKFLRADGTNNVYSSSTIPDTFAQGDIIYGSAANVLTALAKDTNSTRVLTNTGTSNNPAWAQVTLTSGVTGTLPVGNGGTGDASFTSHSALICSGTTDTGALQSVAAVATGQVLTSAGTSTLPAWSAAPTVTSITFGAGTALNTYQEGTWTPTIQFGGANANQTYSAQTGFYTKIGDRVLTEFGAIFSNKGTSTGVVTIITLPFTSANTTTGTCNANFSRILSYPTSCTYLMMTNSPNTTTLAAFGVGANTVSQLTHSNYDNTSNTNLSLCYQT